MWRSTGDRLEEGVEAAVLTLGRNCLHKLTVVSIFLQSSFAINVFSFICLSQICAYLASIHLFRSLRAEKLQKAELTLPATLSWGPIHQLLTPDGLRVEKGADKELLGGMEVDGREFSGLGVEVRALRPVGRRGIRTRGNEIICRSQVKNGCVIPPRWILCLTWMTKRWDGTFQGREQLTCSNMLKRCVNIWI